MNAFKNILSYLIASLFIIGFWKIWTLTGNYAFNPKGKEMLMLDIALTSIFVYKTIFWLFVGNLIVITISHLIKRNVRSARIFAVVTILFYLIIGQIIQIKCAPDYYTVFLNQSVSEDLLERPIKEAGYHIGPILTKDISDKAMKLRRYAIAGLGEIKYKPAIPVLKQILYDNTEQDFIRAEVLETLTSINTKDSKRIINEFMHIDNQVDQKVIEIFNTWTKSK